MGNPVCAIFDGRRLLRKSEVLGELPSGKSVLQYTLRVAWPSMLESFLVSLVGLIDSLMVSSLGSYAIAAVGLTNQPKFIFLAVFLSLNVAVSAIVARRKGEGDRESANRVLMQAIMLVGIFTVILSITGVVFARDIMKMAGAEADTIEYATIYFQIIVGGMIFNVISMVINAAQRGIGNTKIAMYTNITSNLVNVVFNYLLIGGNFGFPKLGVAGAAIATVIGTVCACVMSILSLRKRENFVSLSCFKNWRFEKRTMKSIANLGSSTLAEQLFLRVGFMIFAIIVAKLGTNAFAAHQIGMNLLSISFSIGDGLSVACVAMVGQSLGKKRPDLAKIYGASCQIVGLMGSFLLFLVFLFFGRGLFELFSNEKEILDVSVTLSLLISVIVFLQISQVIYSGCLRGGGDTKFVAFVSLISVTIFRPISAWVFCYPVGWGLIGVWIGLVIDQTLRFLMTSIRFKGGKWTKIRI